MRQQYHEQLEDISNGLVQLTQLVGDAMGRATRALLETDLQAAESVIASDVDIDERADALEELALDVIALQAPVAGELRSLVGALRISATLERMGDLAEHIAQIARRRYPDPVVPEELVPTLREMGELAVRLASDTGDIIKSVDVTHALRLESEDDRMDEYHRQMFMKLLAPDWSHGVEAAIDITLISRFYERFADHAVSVARRVVHQATGQRPQTMEQG
ncbi:MAG: phosphate signaling complex protein PhoU [Candidatus Nanopelagicales bacterium]